MKYRKAIVNAFTVDLEDWYQGIELPLYSWKNQTDRLRNGIDPLLQLLDDHNTKATFFTLGWIGKKYPKLVKEILNAGHELASHGFSHEKVYDLTPETFREDVSKTKKILEDISGNEITSYRAPFFSITNKSLWSLDILKDVGYSIDCSISPVKTWRYGIPNVPDEIFKIKENGLIEYPVSALKILTKKIGIGGAYFRIFPYSFTRNAMRKRNKCSKINMFYIHPWEYDPHHPIVNMERKAKFTHYRNLVKTIPYTNKLLNDFNFDTVCNVVEETKKNAIIKEYSIEILKD
jgi:polysaccharide deacetylase family protein (PEP-CTERM system associated)